MILSSFRKKIFFLNNVIIVTPTQPSSIKGEGFLGPPTSPIKGEGFLEWVRAVLNNKKLF
jgi:hypothetical protein